MNFPPKKVPAQRDKILALLRSRGAKGATNLELYQICLRPPSRLCELRQMGHNIETIREGDSVFRFILHGEPQTARHISDFMQRRRDEEARELPLFVGGAA